MSVQRLSDNRAMRAMTVQTTATAAIAGDRDDQ